MKKADKLEKCQKERDEYLAGWQRSKADFLNYKKEEVERIKELINYYQLELISEILPILDNFEKAKDELKQTKSYKEIIDGFLMIKNQLQNFLEKQGVEEIQCLGQKFDPNFQEVVDEIEAKLKDSATVVEIIQKGYKIKDKVIRPAKVKVSK